MAEEKQDKFVMDFDVTERADRPPQEYYDDIKAKFAEERDLRLEYRPPGTENYRDLDGAMADLARDPYADDWVERAPIDDVANGGEVEVPAVLAGEVPSSKSPGSGLLAQPDNWTVKES